MLETILTSTITVVISLVITLGFNGIINYPKKKKKQEQNILADLLVIKQGLQRVLKNDLDKRYDKWIDLGYIPDDTKNDIEQEYQIYHSLYKNGVMDDKRARCMKLPNRQLFRKEDVI